MPVEPFPTLADSPRPFRKLQRRSPLQVMVAVGFALYLRELKTRMGGQWWGLLWTVGEPLAGAAVMLAIYTTAKAQTLAGVDTLLFLTSGFLPFQLFRTLVLRGMEGIDANQGLLGYRQVRPIDTVLARAAVDVTIFLGITIAAIGLLAWLGHAVTPQHPLELLAYSVVLIVFGTACGLMAATLTAGALHRARAVVRLAFLPLMLASGVVFPLAALPQNLREVLMLNPLAQLLEGLRIAFFGLTYGPAEGVSPATYSVALLACVPVALMLYRLRRDHLLPT